jgi:hypothetical protein
LKPSFSTHVAFIASGNFFLVPPFCLLLPFFQTHASLPADGEPGLRRLCCRFVALSLHCFRVAFLHDPPLRYSSVPLLTSSPPTPPPPPPPPPAVFRARRKKDGVIVALKKIACAGIEDANRALQEGKVTYVHRRCNQSP